MTSKDIMSIKREHPNKALLEKLYQRDSMLRGMYFTKASSIEFLVRDIISYHFCTPGIDEKRHQFATILLDTYLAKVSLAELLEKIISIDYSDLLKEYPSLFEDIHRINEYSLWLYSASLDTSRSFLDSELDDIIRLTYFDKSGVKHQKDVTKEEIEERIADCFNVHFALEDIRSEIRDRVLTNSN
jgi:hypothetical protein